MNIFSDFFTRKTATIRDTIINNVSSMSDTTVMSADIKFESQPLSHFRFTQAEVGAVIMKSPSKSCELDPLLKKMLKKVLDCLLSLITTVIRKSVPQYDVPVFFKKAHVRPVTEKRNRDKEVLENY